MYLRQRRTLRNSWHFDCTKRTRQAMASLPEPDRYGRGDNLRPVYTPRDKKKRSRLTEWLLFGVLGIIVLIGAIALYTQYAPSFKKVPNRVADGFKAI